MPDASHTTALILICLPPNMLHVTLPPSFPSILLPLLHYFFLHREAKEKNNKNCLYKSYIKLNENLFFSYKNTKATQKFDEQCPTYYNHKLISVDSTDFFSIDFPVPSSSLPLFSFSLPLAPVKVVNVGCFVILIAAWTASFLLFSFSISSLLFSCSLISLYIWESCSLNMVWANSSWRKYLSTYTLLLWTSGQRLIAWIKFTRETPRILDVNSRLSQLIAKCSKATLKLTWGNYLL